MVFSIWKNIGPIFIHIGFAVLGHHQLLLGNTKLFVCVGPLCWCGLWVYIVTPGGSLLYTLHDCVCVVFLVWVFCTIYLYFVEGVCLYSYDHMDNTQVGTYYSKIDLLYVLGVMVYIILNNIFPIIY